VGEENDGDRRAALTRLLDHYGRLATEAIDLLYPYEADTGPRLPPWACAPALSDPAEAEALLSRALAVARAIGHHSGELSALLGLGDVRRSRARGLFDDFSRALGDRPRLAHACRAPAQDEPGRRHWRAALRILTALGVERTEDEEEHIRAHLDRLERAGSGSPTV
jgi:hypothetical protein